MKTKILLPLFIFFALGYFLINYTIGNDKAYKLKELLTENQQYLIKKYIFPYKKIDNLEAKLSQNNQIIKTDGKRTFELKNNNNIFVYNKENYRKQLKITGILNDKKIVCYKHIINKSFKLNLSQLNPECNKSIFYIGEFGKSFFYFAKEKQTDVVSKNLVIIPATNFYNYSSNIQTINQYTSSIDYLAKLNEVPFNNKMRWAEKTAKSIHNLNKVIKNFDILFDYNLHKTNIENYKLIILPLHQEYISNKFIEQIINFLNLENKMVLSIGGANFQRIVNFKEDYIIYEKDKFFDNEKYNLNTFDYKVNQNCLFLDNDELNLEN